MVKEIYVCEGECKGEVPVEKAGDSPTCQAETCDKHGQPLTKKIECEQCHARFNPGEEHTCA